MTKRSDKGEPGKRAARNVHKANLGSQLSIFDTGSFARARLARTTRPNEFTRAPSNDPPERPKRSDKGESGKRAARTCTKPTSGHNLAFLIRARSPGRALARTTRPNEFTRAPSNDPPERFCMGARTTETKRQGRAGQTSCTNVHKANLGSQLSIFDTGSFARARPRPSSRPRPNEFTWAPERPKRSDKGEPGKRAARTCTKPTSGHNLAFLIRARSPGRAPSPERPARTSSHGRPQTTRPNDRNEATRESRANELHERAQSQPRVTT
jgi:hypothetical protein